eukprot:CAMPEP_0197861166 /NCGR_PEP_ID=MMETSP1438-20131217/37043_1 /TAXON_ID=1461541 /ORGANISM="Pterosperma sp., Strain CCMP1384" /LENGTH=462 /DNA_ID=CAMNT_0043478255 /DNA_START=332 /DNA_END=1720 /DNA_ORIENTATION=+
MPPLQSKIEGRGNGIKTNIVNMVDVAKALARPPSYTTKFFGCELGAQSKFDEKTGTAIVNGAHDTSKLTQHLEIFIKKFVQCYACGNPETVIQITKGECIQLQCKACGNISNVDMRHKLTTFILKNPPMKKSSKKEDKASKQMRRAEQERMEEGEAIDKAERAAKKEAKRKEKERLEKLEKEEKKKRKERRAAEKAGIELPKEGEKSEEEAEPEEEDDDDVEWATDTSAAAQARRAVEQLTGAAAQLVTAEEEINKKARAEEKKRAEAEKAAAAAAKVEEARKAAEKLDLEDDEDEDSDESDDEVDEDELVETVRGFAAKNPGKVADLVKKLPGCSDLLKSKVLVLALFGDTGKGALAPQIKEKKKLLVPHGGEGNDAGQLALLAGFEFLLGVTDSSLLKETGMVLKTLYDEDICEEDNIVAWSGKADSAKSIGCDAKAAQAVRKAAMPFVNWLAEADEDSD